MSGLEPIAALGLACNILQVVGIGRETVRLARKVYQDGELDPALGENAELLRKISDAIRTTATATAARDKQLLNLADKCHGAARNLDEEVKFLHGVPGGKAKLMVALRVAAKTTWRKRRLDNLDRKLKETEAHLQTGLLARILYVFRALSSPVSTKWSDFVLPGAYIFSARELKKQESISQPLTQACGHLLKSIERVTPILPN